MTPQGQHCEGSTDFFFYVYFKICNLSLIKCNAGKSGGEKWWLTSQVQFWRNLTLSNALYVYPRSELDFGSVTPLSDK